VADLERSHSEVDDLHVCGSIDETTWYALM